MPHNKSTTRLYSVAVITPDSDVFRTFRQPRFDSGYDLIFCFFSHHFPHGRFFAPDNDSSPWSIRLPTQVTVTIGIANTCGIGQRKNHRDEDMRKMHRHILLQE